MLIGWWCWGFTGHTRTLRRAVGDYGAYAGEGRRAYHRGHGFVRASRPGH